MISNIHGSEILGSEILLDVWSPYVLHGQLFLFYVWLWHEISCN